MCSKYVRKFGASILASSQKTVKIVKLSLYIYFVADTVVALVAWLVKTEVYQKKANTPNPEIRNVMCDNLTF